MKHATALLTCLWMLCSSPVQAGGFYAGPNVGIMNADGDLDNAVNGGILLGYDYLQVEVFSASIEAGFTTTLSDGDIETGGLSGNWDIDTQAAYASFRLGNPIYLKARFGWLRTDFSADIGGTSFNDTDNTFTWGSAVGWFARDNIAAELSWTLIDSDIDYISLGLQYHF